MLSRINFHSKQSSLVVLMKSCAGTSLKPFSSTQGSSNNNELKVGQSTKKQGWSFGVMPRLYVCLRIHFLPNGKKENKPIICQILRSHSTPPEGERCQSGIVSWFRDEKRQITVFNKSHSKNGKMKIFNNPQQTHKLKSVERDKS